MNVFNIIGPIMVGPSSSHTAGANRIGYVAQRLLPDKVKKAQITLVGSFGKTFKGHGTDKAILAGIMGYKPYDTEIKDAFEIAKKRHLIYSFKTMDNPSLHPNTAIIKLVDINDNKIEIEGCSIGGGNIIITKINGMPSGFTGENDTLIIPHKDTPGVIASVTKVLNDNHINISGFKLSRIEKGSQAMMIIELDSGIKKTILNELRKIPNIISVVYLKTKKEEKND